MTDHRHIWHEEQQTRHRYCAACGKHEPPSTCGDRPAALWVFLNDPKTSALWTSSAREVRK